MLWDRTWTRKGTWDEKRGRGTRAPHDWIGHANVTGRICRVLAAHRGRPVTAIGAQRAPYRPAREPGVNRSRNGDGRRETRTGDEKRGRNWIPKLVASPFPWSDGRPPGCPHPSALLPAGSLLKDEDDRHCRHEFLRGPWKQSDVSDKGVRNQCTFWSETKVSPDTKRSGANTRFRERQTRRPETSFRFRRVGPGGFPP
jgi:hypothetical protein